MILGCHKLGLGVIRALGERNVPVVGVYYNKNDMGYASKYVAESHFCPNPDLDEKGFVDVLMHLGKDLKGSVLIPSDDPTLYAASKNKALLERCYRTSFAGWDVIEKIIEKKYTYRIAAEAGVPAPKTITPGTISEAKRFIGEIGFPCLLKPSIGHQFFAIFKKKMITIRNEMELEESFRLAQKSNVEMMLQELIPGDDTHGFNYNSYFVDGKPMVEFTAQKCRLSPPGTGFPRVIVSKYVPELFEYGRKMILATGYSGYSCMEFKRDERNGIYMFMEINGRQNLSTSLAVKCGINFPYLTYEHTVRGEFPEVEGKYRTGVYWIDLEKDIYETFKSFRLEGFSLSTYLMPYFSPRAFSVVSLKDPQPAIKRVADGLKVMRNKLNRHEVWGLGDYESSRA